MPNVLLLMPTTSYRAHDLLAGARRRGIDVVVGTERKQALEDLAPSATITLDLDDLAATLARIEALHRRQALSAVLGVDDETLIVAAEAASRLGLRGNPPAAVRDARDKYRMRQRLEAAGVRGPGHRLLRLSDASEAAETIPYPCVLKPRTAAASRGVIRADDPAELVAAARRIASILGADPGDDVELLVEDYLPGDELAVEGLLEDGTLRLLALFDKPDPLEGPTFEETIYTTPSRHSPEDRAEVGRCVQEAVTALGLRHGPVHAEVRLCDGLAILLEVAPRCIGGLCPRALRFGNGSTLEELILLDALGEDVRGFEREHEAAGVMMIPIPRAGILRRVSGQEDAAAVPGVREVTISTLPGQPIVAPPEGSRYLGFIFASAPGPAEAEAALRKAHGKLCFEIDPDYLAAE